ncbi:zinc finger protein 611-like [Littorina saxatilis]|uniref:zinc finger protein 611-like n=1 Tax=Littorina saxatilis TaxID=31220 RepID=UPI0038B5638D
MDQVMEVVEEEEAELSAEFMDSYLDIVQTPEKEAKVTPKETSTPKEKSTSADDGAGPSTEKPKSPKKKKTPMKKKMEASADKSVHQCHECGKTYKHYRTLWAHQRFDHGEGKTNHKCTICDKKFTKKLI